LVFGVATINMAHTPSVYLLAIVPLFFVLQQLMEGLFWLSIPRSEFENIRAFATTFFLIMADVLWPIIIPLALLLKEKQACIVSADRFGRYDGCLLCL